MSLQTLLYTTDKFEQTTTKAFLGKNSPAVRSVVLKVEKF